MKYDTVQGFGQVREAKSLRKVPQKITAGITLVYSGKGENVR